MNLWLAAWIAAAAHAAVPVLAPATVGEEVSVQLTDDDGGALAGETIRIVTAPGLHSEAERGVGITDSQGRVVWTPKASGPAILYAGDRPLVTVEVRPALPDASAIVPFLLLLVAAIGAIAYGSGPRGARS
ncbi:MAG: hypothetical protein H6733_09065 [Alphaproteobacteria bacterium]|nr:hypothetical protein [Alphaproteobacteria bacterium]